MQFITFSKMFALLVLIICVFCDSGDAFSCRVCHKDCKTTNIQEMPSEECPNSDIACFFVFKEESNRNSILHGGCSGSLQDYCYEEDNTRICVRSCKGNLCNQNIDLRS